MFFLRKVDRTKPNEPVYVKHDRSARLACRGGGNVGAAARGQSHGRESRGRLHESITDCRDQQLILDRTRSGTAMQS